MTIVTRPTPAQDPMHPDDRRVLAAATARRRRSRRASPAASRRTTSRPRSPARSCHTTPGNYAVATMNHTGITSGCATCHATGLSFANIVPVSPPATHVPTTQACETLPLARQVHQFQRRHDEPRRHHHRLRELPRQRQELLRRDYRNAAGHAHSRRHRRLRELPLDRQVHQLRRHGDESRADRGHPLRHAATQAGRGSTA